MLIAGTMGIRVDLPSESSRAGLDAWVHLWGAMDAKEGSVALASSPGIVCIHGRLYSFPLCSAVSVLATVYIEIETIFVDRFMVHDR